MKIGISTSVIQRGKTGVAQYVFSILQEMEAYSGANQFVLFVLEEDLPLFEDFSPTMELVPVSERYRPPIRNVFWHQTALPRLARARSLDVLHIPSYRRMLWNASCAQVATIHDLAAFHVRRKYDWKRMFYGRVVARHLAHRQDELIAVSENTARDMGTFWGIPRPRVTVIYHGIDRLRFSAGWKGIGQNFCRNRFGIESPFFLYVARLEHPGKNHVRLIQAFERFKAEEPNPWKLVLAGSDWHGADQIHSAIAQSSASSDIRCLGFVEADDLPLLYSGADVFVYPSLHEGFGLPPLEAMASGCPVLTSACGALGEIAGPAAVTVDPESVEAMQRQLSLLARDEAKRGALRKAGLAWCRRYDWAQAAAQTMSVYGRAVGKGWRDDGSHRRHAYEQRNAAVGLEHQTNSEPAHREHLTTR